MKKNIIVALAATWCAVPVFAGPGPAWAWDANKITNNGSVQIKSSNGTSTYDAVQNPTGAVAKVNQSAVTQPPTVIIQATSGGYAETIPLLVQGTTVPPSCPAGYTRVFTASQTGCPTSQVWNAGGTRWSLFPASSGNDVAVFWSADNAPSNPTQSASFVKPLYGPSTTCDHFVDYSTPHTLYPWAASLCTK